jgi:hypothetical protein
LKEKFTAKSTKSKKEEKKGPESKTFFDCEPLVRFDFFDPAIFPLTDPGVS